jgi:hypothetical protein
VLLVHLVPYRDSQVCAISVRPVNYTDVYYARQMTLLLLTQMGGTTRTAMKFDDDE